MPGMGHAPGGAVAMEDVCDLQPWAAHGRRLQPGYTPGSWAPFGQRRKAVERAGDRSDRGVGNTRVKRRGVELGMAEEHLNDADVGVLFQ
jgi:hypothetical protein